MAGSNVGFSNTAPRDQGGEPRASLPTPADRAELNLLVQQVSELEARVDEAERPWYRNASTTIPIAVSVLALAASVAIPIRQDREAGKQRAQQQLTTDVEMVSTLVGQVVDLRRQNTEQLASTSTSNPGLSQAESQLLNAKKLSAQEKAKVLLANPQVASQADPGAIRVLASELGLSGEESNDKNMLRKLLDRKDVRGWDRANTMSTLAYWEMLPDAAPAEIADGRENMKQVIAFYQQQPGEYAKEAVVQGYLSWANQELLVSNRQGAKQELETAQVSLDHLNPFNPDKPLLARLVVPLANMIDSAQPGPSAGLPDIDQWFGSWTVNIGPASERSGPLLLSLNKQTNLVDARFDVFDRGALVEKYVGSGYLLDAKILRIDWLGVVRPAPAPGYGPTQTYGYTTLSLDRSNALEMKTYLLGEAMVSGHGVKSATH